MINRHNLSSYLSIWARITGWMLRWAFSRKTFWWTFLSGPVLIWSLVGHFETSPLLLSASTFSYLLPAAILMGWSDSELKKKLSVILHPAQIGTRVLLMSEIILPLSAGILPSVIILIFLSHLSMIIPWQTWVIVPFSALSAVSLILIIENYCSFSGRIIYFILVAGQAIGRVFISSQMFRILLFPGYILQTVQWAQSTEKHLLIHGDTYMILAVVEGFALFLFMLKVMKVKQFSVIEQ